MKNENRRNGGRGLLQRCMCKTGSSNAFAETGGDALRVRIMRCRRSHRIRLVFVAQAYTTNFDVRELFWLDHDHIVGLKVNAPYTRLLDLVLPRLRRDAKTPFGVGPRLNDLACADAGKINGCLDSRWCFAAVPIFFGDLSAAYNRPDDTFDSLRLLLLGRLRRDRLGIRLRPQRQRQATNHEHGDQGKQEEQAAAGHGGDCIRKSPAIPRGKCKAVKLRRAMQSDFLTATPSR